MCEFEKNKRVIFLQKAFYLENKEFFEEDKQEDIFVVKMPEWMYEQGDTERDYHQGLSWSQISRNMRYCQLLYSAGRPMPEVITATHDMLERFHKHFDIDFPEDKLQLWEADSYAYILWLLGLAVLSNHRESLERIPNWLAPALDTNGDWIKGGAPLVDVPMKALLDLIGYSGKLQINPEPFFPKSVYTLIPEIINPTQETDKPVASSREKRSKLLQQYLRGWYKTNKDTYWYDTHEKKIFFGYWSFEAGMLSVLLKVHLDSKSFKEMSFYPQDYVQYALQHGFASLK